MRVYALSTIVANEEGKFHAVFVVAVAGTLFVSELCAMRIHTQCVLHMDWIPIRFECIP